MTNTHLFLFQIGPVQSFIAAARRTQDLFVGSRILSTIAQAGVEAALQADSNLLFPALQDGVLPYGIPHRFAFLSDHTPESVADHIETALQQCWQQDIAGKVRNWLQQQIGMGEWMEVFDRQVKHWLEIYWVAMPYTDDSHGQSYSRVVAALAARKQLRYFPAVKEPGRKCTLTGAQSALPLDWGLLQKRLIQSFNERFVLRDNEALGALATVKRFAQLAGCDLGEEKTLRFADMDSIARRGKTNSSDDEVPRIAVLHMDGDRMGKTLSLCQDAYQHQRLSQVLSAFAEEVVPQIVERHQGDLIYAGGDDVLALMPLYAALPCADALRQALYQLTLEETGSGITASAGIALTPANLPLDIALDEARRAEHRAKNDYGRNAVVVRETHRSGQIRQAGAQWAIESNVDNEATVSIPLVPFVNDLQEQFASGLSGKLGYDLQEIAYAMAGPHLPPQARRAEVKRLLTRRSQENMNEVQQQAVIDALALPIWALGEAQHCGWDSVANWTILARLLSKETYS